MGRIRTTIGYGVKWHGFSWQPLTLLVGGLAVAGLIAGCVPAPSPTVAPPTVTSPIAPSPAPPVSSPATPPAPPPAPSPTPIPSPTPPPAYRLATSVSPPSGGIISPDTGTFGRGSPVTLRATAADACWAFDRWGGDVTSNSNPVTLTMDGSKTLTAYFTKVKYTLSVDAVPPVGGKVSPASESYDCGSTVTLVATPALDYEFDHWGGDASGFSATVNVTMRSRKAISAYFRTVYQTIKRDMPPGSAALNTVTYSKQLKAGERVQGFIELTGEYQPADITYSWNFSITGPQGLIVENWQGNVVSTQRHDFDKIVPVGGTYVMKIDHNSRFSKTMTVRIKPGGW